MKKVVRYPQVHFDRGTVEAAIAKADELLITALAASGSYYYREGMSASVRVERLDIGGIDYEWGADSLDDHFVELANAKRDGRFVYSRITVRVETLGEYILISVDEDVSETRVNVMSPDRDAILLLQSIFENAAPDARVETPIAPPEKPRIFIGHGGASRDWMDLDMHLTRHHQIETVHYESGSRSGHTIRDVLDEMLDESSLAILVMTAEDEQADQTFRARQNVVHEAGLFQGRLGFRRTIILREADVEGFSNLDGIQYIPFSTIRETFGDVLSVIRREFGAF